MTHYCYLCGTALKHEQIEGRQREICPHCGWIHYEHRKVSAGVRVEKDQRLLLTQRAIEPWYGKWYLPAGYLEIDEQPAEAAVRETLEETGLQVKLKGLAGIYTYEDDPRGNGIVLLYDAEVRGGALCTSNESLKSGFFSAVEIGQMEFAGAGVEQQVQDWLKKMDHDRGES